jgi:hypothetical protein
MLHVVLVERTLRDGRGAAVLDVPRHANVRGGASGRQRARAEAGLCAAAALGRKTRFSSFGGRPDRPAVDAVLRTRMKN